MSGDYHGDDHPSPWGPHDWGHGAPHNSYAPLVMSIGVGIFLLTFGGLFAAGLYLDIPYGVCREKAHGKVRCNKKERFCSVHFKHC